MWAGEQINEKYQNGCHLKTLSQNNQKSNQHTVGINVIAHTKCEVSMISKLQVRITKYLMCIYGGHMCISVPNMKFLCLTQCQGEVCTDAEANNTG